MNNCNAELTIADDRDSPRGVVEVEVLRHSKKERGNPTTRKDKTGVDFCDTEGGLG